MSENIIKAVAFDVDGTLVRENFWGPLHKIGGMSVEEDLRLFESYIAGTLGYREWMKTIVGAYRESPPTRADVERLYREFSLIPGADEVVTSLQSMPLALISSNVDTFVRIVALHFGIPHAYAFCRFEFDASDRLSGMGFHGEGNELEHKVEALQDFALKAGVSVQEIAFVGDSKNDLEAFRATGRGILVGEGTEELRRVAWKQVPTIDHVIPILHRAEHQP